MQWEKSNNFPIHTTWMTLISTILFCFESWSLYVAQISLKFVILLPQPPVELACSTPPGINRILTERSQAQKKKCVL
jgi:hypothetical protein